MTEQDASPTKHTGASTGEQRDRWRRHARALTQLGPSAAAASAPEAVEGVAEATLTLLAEVERLEPRTR
jgi:hypothetical protein